MFNIAFMLNVALCLFVPVSLGLSSTMKRRWDGTRADPDNFRRLQLPWRPQPPMYSQWEQEDKSLLENISQNIQGGVLGTSEH